jgi:hypothetical protein
MVLDFIKGKKKGTEMIHREAILDMSEFLISYGFTPSEAIKTSETFWNKNRKKLEKVVS